MQKVRKNSSSPFIISGKSRSLKRDLLSMKYAPKRIPNKKKAFKDKYIE